MEPATSSSSELKKPLRADMVGVDAHSIACEGLADCVHRIRMMKMVWTGDSKSHTYCEVLGKAWV